MKMRSSEKRLDRFPTKKLPYCRGKMLDQSVKKDISLLGAIRGYSIALTPLAGKVICYQAFLKYRQKS